MSRLFGAILVALFLLGVFASTDLSFGLCRTVVVMVKGRVEHSPLDARVRVRLILPKGRSGESGEVSVDHGRFTIEIPFSTQSRAPILMGELLEKCDGSQKV